MFKRRLEDHEIVRLMEHANPMAPEDRVFNNTRHLIRALGCRLVASKHPDGRSGLNTVGSSPFGHATLLEGGVVWLHVTSESVKYEDLSECAHEAIHHFCGDKSFDKEVTMMALEFALYGMVKSNKDRHRLFLSLSGTIAGNGYEISTNLCESGEYFKSSDWMETLHEGQRWVTLKGMPRAATLRKLKLNDTATV
jgi:hypothetical protein